MIGEQLWGRAFPARRKARTKNLWQNNKPGMLKVKQEGSCGWRAKSKNRVTENEIRKVKWNIFREGIIRGGQII